MCFLRAAVEVYAFTDQTLRDKGNKEYGQLIGEAESAEELDALCNSTPLGTYMGYYAQGKKLENYEKALEVLGVDPLIYLNY
jgi:hypothetical protein